MKKGAYILLFIMVGFLGQLLIHALLENWYIGLLLNNFDRYSLGLSWDGWFNIHSVGTAVLLVAGLILGYLQGEYWWPRLYDQSGRRKRNWPKTPA